MALKKYIYQGPPSGVSLRLGDGKGARCLEVTFFDQKVVELPSEHPYVQRLAAQGRIKAEENTKAEALKPSKGPTGKTENG